jgi:hypothetical protein
MFSYNVYCDDVLDEANKDDGSNIHEKQAIEYQGYIIVVFFLEKGFIGLNYEDFFFFLITGGV